MRKLWMLLMAVTALAAGIGDPAPVKAQGCYELMSRCTLGTDCCSGICERLRGGSFCTGGSQN